jgi:hypothetical protein
LKVEEFYELLEVLKEREEVRVTAVVHFTAPFLYEDRLYGSKADAFSVQAAPSSYRSQYSGAARDCLQISRVVTQGPDNETQFLSGELLSAH